MRPVTAVRLLLGSAGLLLTRRVLPLWGADPQDTGVVAVARILAVRHLLQGAAVAAHPSRRTHLASAAVDGLHGLSMVTLAVVSPSYRRSANTSAGVACLLAGLTGISLRRAEAGDRHGASDPKAGGVLSFPVQNAQSDRPPGRTTHVTAPSGHHESNPERVREAAHARAAWLTRRSEQALSSSTNAPMRSLSRAGAVVLLVLGVWVLAGQWVLDLRLTSVGTTTGIRDEGFAVLLILAALRLLVAGSSKGATCVAFLCGVLLACSGLFLHHSATRSAVNEALCGGIALFCAVATLDRRRAGARAVENLVVGPA